MIYDIALLWTNEGMQFPSSDENGTFTMINSESMRLAKYHMLTIKFV